MQLSILIVNWNSKKYLRQCLYSIRLTCMHLSPQIIVVDGGSFDGCDEMINKEFPEAEFVQMHENVGFAMANNAGFKKVNGDVLLLLNPDTELLPMSVDVLIEGLLSLPQAGMIGARLLNSDGSHQLCSVHELPGPLNCAFDSEFLRKLWWIREGRLWAEEPFMVEAISGACMMIRTDTFRMLSGFDQRYYMYAEDMDLCYRIGKMGMCIYHAPRSKIIHHGGGCSSKQFGKFQTVMIKEALGVYIKKNNGCIQLSAYYTLTAMVALLKTFVSCLCIYAADNKRRQKYKILTVKWYTVLRWSLGMESWSRKYFRCVNADLKTHVFN